MGGRPKLAPASRGFLEEAWRRHEHDRLHGWELVVHRGDGRPIRDYRRGWLTALKRTGLAGKEIRPYDIRHLAASALLDGGTPLPVVAGLLGHSSPAVTAKVYAHALEGRARQAVEEMPALGGGETGRPRR